AGYPYDNFSLFSPFKVVQNTFSTTASVLSASISNHVKRFIYCSSMSRYGNNESPFTEDMSPKPLTPYAVAKVAGENLIKSMAQVHNFEYVICIPHNIFGPQQVYNDPYRNAVSLIANQMLNDKPPLIYGDGTQERAFTPIQDLTPMFSEILFGEKAKNQIINIGPDEEVINLNKLTKILNEILGKNLKAVYKPFRQQEVKTAVCKATKARKLLNYKKAISLRSALEELTKWIQKQGPTYFSYHQKPEIDKDYFPISWKQKIL
ncbi:MAG: NAD-dependent epimerase/dehydratase family protein, partial [Oligoflexia bacterium]|nr:NAD-dependent epimerase/dehydratase family protein [Oligoflexia bacterium]